MAQKMKLKIIFRIINKKSFTNFFTQLFSNDELKKETPHPKISSLYDKVNGVTGTFLKDLFSSTFLKKRTKKSTDRIQKVL